MGQGSYTQAKLFSRTFQDPSLKFQGLFFRVYTETLKKELEMRKDAKAMRMHGALVAECTCTKVTREH